MNDIKNKGVIAQGQRVFTLKLADDVSIIDKDPDILQGMLVSFVLITRDLECPSVRVNKVINIQENNSEYTEPTLNIDGSHVENVKSFVYHSP